MVQRLKLSTRSVKSWILLMLLGGIVISSSACSVGGTVRLGPVGFGINVGAGSKEQPLSDLFDQATAKAQKGDYQGAIDDYSACIEANPQPSAYTNRGIAYAALGQYDSAIADFDEAIKQNPNWLEAYINRGSTRAALRGDLKGAIADFDQAIRINPKSVEAYASRGSARSDLGDFTGAISDLTQAIQLNPKYTAAYIRRAAIYAKSGDPVRAIADYNRVAELAREQGDSATLERASEVIKQLQFL